MLQTSKSLRWAALMTVIDHTDVITAYAWMHLSAENGFVFAPRDKDKIAKTMFAGQIIRAEEIAATLQTNLPAANSAATASPTLQG